MNKGLTYNRDTDREILLRVSDDKLIETCSLNKYLFENVCDDNFFHQKLLFSYPDILGYFKIGSKEYKNYKQLYLSMIYYISKMKEDFHYSYTSGNPKIQYEIFKDSLYNKYSDEYDPKNYNKVRYVSLLFNAMSKNEFNLVKEAVEKGTDINSVSALIQATKAGNDRFGNIKMVQYLVEQGANVRAQDDYPIYNASESGNLEIAKYLVEHGANIHAGDERALRIASKNGHLNIVKYLVSLGADIHAENEESLRWAIINEHLDVAKYLVREGANIQNAIIWATKYRQFNAVNYLRSL